MRLSGRPLTDVSNVNDYAINTQMEFTSGDPVTFYLQLIDLDKRPVSQGFSPPGQRYMPVAGATLQITFINIDDAKQIVRFAIQPFAQDPSIWSVSLLSTDPINGTVSIKVVLTESGNTKTFTLPAAILAN